MTEEEVRSMFAEAQRETPAGEARLKLAVRTAGNAWTLVFSTAAGELAIQVEEPDDGSRRTMKARIVAELRRLF